MAPGAGNLDCRSVRFSPLVRSETGDVDEAGNVVSHAGRGDDRTAVGMTGQQDRPADLFDHGLEVLTVAAGQAAQRVRRSQDRHVFAEELVMQAAKPGCVRERAVDENNGGVSHFLSPRAGRMNGPRASGDAGSKSTGDLARADGSLRPRVSRIWWRTTVAHLPAEDRRHGRCAAESACTEEQGGGCGAALPGYNQRRALPLNGPPGACRAARRRGCRQISPAPGCAAVQLCSCAACAPRARSSGSDAGCAVAAALLAANTASPGPAGPAQTG